MNGEYPFGVARGKGHATTGLASLIKHRRTLPRRLTHVRARHVEILAVVIDLVDLGRVDEHVAIAIARHRVFLPGVFPQLVADLHILLGAVIALVMGHHLAETEVRVGVGQIGRHDVPGHAPIGQMIERREQLGGVVGRKITGAESTGETEMAGDRRHGRNDQGRIVTRELRAIAHRRVTRTTIDAVGAVHVRQEQGVEKAGLEDARQIHPIMDVAIAIERTIERMLPLAYGVMADTALCKGIHVYALGHRLRSSSMSVQG